MRLLHVVSILGLLVAGPSLSSAGEESKAAAQRFEKARAALPAPSAKGAFLFEGDLVMEGQQVGTLRLEVLAAKRPGAEEEGLLWKAAMVLGAGPGLPGSEIEETVWLDSALTPVAGHRDGAEIGGRRKHEWIRGKSGFTVKSSGEGLTPFTRVAKPDGPCTTWLGLLLFARTVLGEKATYASQVFSPAWEYLRGERPFKEGTLQIKGPGTWREKKALLVDLKGAGQLQQFAFDPETKQLMGMTMRHVASGATSYVVPREAGKRVATEDPFEGPPKTPEHGALQVALAFQTGDAERFERLVHWPSLREAMKASIKGQVSDEDFKKAILKQFRAASSSAPEDETRRRLRESAGALEVQKEGDDKAMVTLPESFGKMRITLQRFEGVWHLVRPPRAGGV